MDLVHTLPRSSPQSAVPMQTNALTRIGIALFNGFALATVAAIIEIFQKANSLVAAPRSGRARYDVSLLSVAGGRIASSSSVFAWTDDVQSHRATNETHLLFIAGGGGVQQACRDERLTDWLRRMHPFSEIVHPIAEGQLLPQAAGLPCRYCPLLSGGVEAHGLHPARSLTEAPGAVSTALRILEDDLGADLAQQVAKSIGPPPQTPFNSSITPGVAPQISEKILTSAHWLEANIDQPISIDDAAHVAATSERNFLRRFKSEIGMTPSD
ncbi:UNVERIFIED_ORG: transcriptional regulator GlxA family with amidase domain [Paraburkholderia sediminicola]|nr:transcriptional regulator GlxA family with amidase domain [Paraburkholderia sediminicola]